MVVKSGLMRVGQKQMDRFSLVIKFTLLSWLTLRGREGIQLVTNQQTTDDKCFIKATFFSVVVIFLANIVYALAKSIFLHLKSRLSARPASSSVTSGMRYNNSAAHFSFGTNTMTRERKRLTG